MDTISADGDYFLKSTTEAADADDVEASVKTGFSTYREAAGADDLSVGVRADVIAGREATGAWEHVSDSVSASEGVTDAFRALFGDHQIPTEAYRIHIGGFVPGNSSKPYSDIILRLLGVNGLGYVVGDPVLRTIVATLSAMRAELRLQFGVSRIGYHQQLRAHTAPARFARILLTSF